MRPLEGERRRRYGGGSLLDAAHGAHQLGLGGHLLAHQRARGELVDAGLGAPSHAAAAMEMGADAVLINTAVAVATDPVRMAEAFKIAVAAGRTAHEIGLAPQRREADATSPLTGFLNQ